MQYQLYGFVCFFHALARKPPINPIHARVTRPPCHDASIGPGHIGQMRFRPANTRTILDRIEDITPYCRTTDYLWYYLQTFGVSMFQSLCARILCSKIIAKHDAVNRGESA